eukprot:863504-Amphidinium_carterae.1
MVLLLYAAPSSGLCSSPLCSGDYCCAATTCIAASRGSTSDMSVSDIGEQQANARFNKVAENARTGVTG